MSELNTVTATLDSNGPTMNPAISFLTNFSSFWKFSSPTLDEPSIRNINSTCLKNLLLFLVSKNSNLFDCFVFEKIQSFSENVG